MGGESGDRARTFTFDAAGRALFAVEAGDGWPVVMLHGGLADHRAVRAHLAAPPEQTRLITPDARGSGRSIDPGPLSWSQLADDVAALLDHLGLERAVVGGISLGTGIAVAFALRHPQRTAAAVFVHPTYGGDDHRPTALAVAFETMHAAAERAVDEGIEALLSLYDRLPDGMRERARAMASGFDPASCLASTTLYLQPEQPLTDIGELRRVTVPTLLVPGNDPMHPAEISAAYAATLPDVEVVADGEPLDKAITRLCRRVFS